jgi:tetratricopeptide (TPR) repeat protein
MKRYARTLPFTELVISLSIIITWAWGGGQVICLYAAEPGLPTQFKGFAGSYSCRECHQKFYELWSTSFHGLAMQPYTVDLAKAKLRPQTKDIMIGKSLYRADVSGKTGWVYENGPKEMKKYKIEHVLGGKNVFYFLTPLDKGRLQTLPVAYDVNRKEWFDMAGSGVRHFPERRPDEPLHWKDWQFTFNTMCYSCHVSQLSTNYDLKTDTYRTVWNEPGINCETCHGPAEEHNRVLREAPGGTFPKDLKIIRTKPFTPEQHNSTCGPCHAKMVPLTATFRPGNRFFDHYDLITLEDPDFYPDGRDLGENYTFTLWLMSPCVKSGKLSCLHCHTSSGRYRHKDRPNLSCMPCHDRQVKNPADHTRHQPDSQGSKCISCHMPMTEFARMRRSDHSMLPPAPAATMAFKSPNACNLCHQEKETAWADQWVRQWAKRDYQAPLLQRAGILDAARNRDWSRLPEVLAYLTSRERDEVYAASLIRLLRASRDEVKWPSILAAMNDPSPLVRGAAAEALGGLPSREAGEALLKALSDDYRLVRIRAAASLAGFPKAALDERNQKKLEETSQEYVNSLMIRPDHWSSHYNMGNYHLSGGFPGRAVDAFEKAISLDPRSPYPLVNVAIAYARVADMKKAEESLNKALKIDPRNAQANFNMGLLKAEQKDTRQAERYLRAALKSDPQMAEAAYNLSVLLSKDRPDESIQMCLKAYELAPNVKYGHTLAYFFRNTGNESRAADILQRMIRLWPWYGESYVMLGDIYERQGSIEAAKATYREALAQGGISRRERVYFEEKVKALEPPRPEK